jgi:uncharacterized protein YqeY
MSIESIINNDIKQAMLSREKEKLEALRGIKAALLLEKTKKGGGHEEVADDLALGLLQRLIKQRKESAEIYLSQNRKDLADVELFQAAVIEAYLPAQMSEAELSAVIGGIIAETGASGIKDMGKVMGIASKRLAGKADNKIIAEQVKKMLS